MLPRLATFRLRHLRPRVTGLLAAIVIGSACAPRLPAVQVPLQFPPGYVEQVLPMVPGSLKFAVLGDFGTGGPGQYQMASQMAELQLRFPFALVLTVGDNLYGRQNADNFVKKFEAPYRELLDRGVVFHASLGNHDNASQVGYPPFNMGGQRYYTFSPAGHDVRFFALDSGRPHAAQLEWLERELAATSESWKIAYFHHPLYSSGRRHGSDEALRALFEPLFTRHGVDVVFTGHDHFYERIVPQAGIPYFVVGSGGQLRRGNIASSQLTAQGFDQDLAVLLVEIVGDRMTFRAVSRLNQIVDSGTIDRRRQ